MRARSNGKPIADADWIVLTGDFDNAAAAMEYGNTLQSALAIAAVRARHAVDVGHKNQATLQTSDAVKEAFSANGIAFIDDVHGVDVYPTDMATMTMGLEAAASVRSSVAPLAEEANRIFSEAGRLDEIHRNAVLMLNAARLNNEPLAKLVFAVGAVEMLAGAAKPKWSNAQSIALAALRVDVLKHDGLAPTEAEEVAGAIERLHAVGVMEGCRRLIRGVGLEALLRPWAALYGKRSAILHGSEPAINAELGTLADTAEQICSRIVLAAVAQQVPSAAHEIEVIFPSAEPSA